jgi:hypothetical protein
VKSFSEVYDPASNSWRAIAPMVSKRRYLAGAVVGGLLYALGGYDGSGHLSSREVYDPASNSWRAIAPMGSKRCDLAAAVRGWRVAIRARVTPVIRPYDRCQTI